METVLPQLVGQTNSENGTLTMDYVSLVPVLIKAIQEQHGTLKHQQDALKLKDEAIASLNARLTALEKAMERLSNLPGARLQK